jgi:hypothetical protein
MLFIDLFDLIDDDSDGIITKDKYLLFLKKISYGHVPLHILDEEVIEVIWKDGVLDSAGVPSPTLTRHNITSFLSSIDVHMYLTVQY